MSSVLPILVLQEAADVLAKCDLWAHLIDAAVRTGRRAFRVCPWNPRSVSRIAERLARETTSDQIDLIGVVVKADVGDVVLDDVSSLAS